MCRPREDIKGMIFSRVTCMEHLAAGLDDMKAKAEARGPAPGGLPYLFVDDYLYSIREKSSDAATLDKTYGIMRARRLRRRRVGTGRGGALEAPSVAHANTSMKEWPSDSLEKEFSR